MASHNEEKPFRFLDLAPEIRTKIYRMALVEGEVFSGLPVYINTLAPPALAQVNRQICAEALPIYYGGNHFQIQIPGEQDDFDGWRSLFQMCSSMSAASGLKFIERLSCHYSEPTWEDELNFLFGFDMIGEAPGDTTSSCRIGDNNLDWNNDLAVEIAFAEALDRSVGRYVMEELDMEGRVPIALIGEVLIALAKHCPRANRYVDTWRCTMTMEIKRVEHVAVAEVAYWELLIEIPLTGCVSQGKLQANANSRNLDAVLTSQKGALL